uniref:MFS domain-containing protein n=1 Tax=Panagrellus redivivus TaxID=6233 RepID=A0A7E4UPB3_PANRE
MNEVVQVKWDKVKAPFETDVESDNISENTEMIPFDTSVSGSVLLASMLGNIICWNAALIKVGELESSPLWPIYGSAILNGSVNKADVDWTDSRLPLSDRRIAFTSLQISLIFAASFAGAGFFVLPATWIMRALGTRRTEIILAVATAALAALTPLATMTDFWLLLVVRFIQGMCISNPYPVISVIISTWTAANENGIFLAILTGYVQLSAVFTTPFCIYISHQFGWPSIFYFQAIYIMFLTIIWTLAYRDDPETHPLVGEHELNKISANKHNRTVSIHGDQSNTAVEPTNLQVIRTPAVWVCCVAAFAYITSIQFSITFTVMYYVWILKYPILTAGLISSIPLLSQYLIQFVTNICSDRIRFVTEHTKIRVCCTLALSGCATGFIVTSFIDPQYRILSTTVTVIGLSCLGFNSDGFPKSAVLIGPQKPVLVMSCVQAILTLGLFCGSFIVPGLTPDRTAEQYHVFFRVYGGLLIIANVLFVVFCKAKVIDFTQNFKKSVC